MATFFKNTLKLISGNFVAQLLGILLIPVITRLFTPGDFGIFQLFLSISSIVVVFCCLSYQLAIMLPKEDEDAAQIVALCCMLIIIISVITGIIFILFSDPIGKMLNAPEISPYLIFLPIAIFFNGLYVVRTYWLSRKQTFGLIAASQIVNSVSSKAVQIGLGIYSPSPLGLIAGLITGYVASLAILVKQVKDDFFLFRKVTVKGMRDLAIQYKRFPIYSSWSTLANTLSTQVVTFFLVFFFNPAIVGYYAIANMVVFLPMGLIGSAMSQVFFQKACDEKNRTGSVKNIVREIQQRLISLGMFPMFILIIIGTDLFTFVLGAQWFVAGQYAGILAPWLLFVFIASPLSLIFDVLERQNVELGFNLLILVSRIAALAIGGFYGDPVLALALFSITGVIFWGWMNLYILNISGVSRITGLIDYFRFFSLALVLALPLIAVKLLSFPAYILFIVAGIVTLLYYGAVLLGDPVLKNELFRTLRRI